MRQIQTCQRFRTLTVCGKNVQKITAGAFPLGQVFQPRVPTRPNPRAALPPPRNGRPESPPHRQTGKSILRDLPAVPGNDYAPNMSKAFTREDDSAPETELRPHATVGFPGAKQFLTASGAHRLKADLEQFLQTERPPLAARVDDPDAKRRLQILDARIEELRRILSAATVVAPPPLPWDQVRFGASVTVRNRAGVEEQYRIVGPAELDADRGWVSPTSPIGRALLNARLGQRIRYRAPGGEEELEIVRIIYE